MKRKVNNGNKFSTHLHKTQASEVKATETEELQKAVAEEMVKEDPKGDLETVFKNNTIVQGGKDGEEEKTPENNS